jgi:hypothetical protein
MLSPCAVHMQDLRWIGPPMKPLRTAGDPASIAQTRGSLSDPTSTPGYGRRFVCSLHALKIWCQRSQPPVQPAGKSFSAYAFGRLEQLAIARLREREALGSHISHSATSMSVHHAGVLANDSAHRTCGGIWIRGACDVVAAVDYPPQQTPATEGTQAVEDNEDLYGAEGVGLMANP